MKKKAAKQQKRQVVKIKSTQMFSPVRDVRDGIIVTKDGRFIKLLEFSPINFGLRSSAEQDGIIDAFCSAVKLMPRNTQWKVLSNPANIAPFVDKIRQDMSTEDNENCRELQQDQIELITHMGARGGVSRRFFVALEYEEPDGMSRRPSFDEIRAELETTALRIASFLEPVGNMVLSPAGDDRYTIETLYSIFCRSESLQSGFEERMADVVSRYMADDAVRIDDNDSYIPINDFISPHEIDFSISPKYIVVDDMYYSFGYLPSACYPTKAVGGWLSVLINFGIGVDCDVFLSKANPATMEQKLQYSIRYNRVKARSTEESAAGYEELLDAIDSGFYLRQGIANGEDFIYFSVLLTVCAGSEDELTDKWKALRAYLGTQGLKLKQCLFQQEEAFLSSIPLCSLAKNIQQKSRRNILSSAMASAYPFVSFEVADPSGIMLGVNNNNNSLVFIDNFDTSQYKNANMCLLGASGSGKTYTLQCMALRMRQQKTQVIIIAPVKGHEFKRACEAIGGQYIKIAPGSGQNINIMEIRKTDDTVAKLLGGEAGMKEESILAQKIQQIHTAISLIIPDMSYEERQQLDEALVKTYAKFGISHRNRSLIDPATGNYKKMPILGDLHTQLGQMGEPAKRLYNILTRYVKGSAKSFNAQTNVDLDNSYVVIDLSSLNSEMLSLGMHTALCYAYDTARADITKKKAIIVDEAWYLRSAMGFLVEIFKVIRGYGGAAIAATQDMQDFFSYKDGIPGKAIISNAKTKIVLGMEQDEASYVSDILGLSARETQQITRFKRGQALIVSNTNHLVVNIKASQAENDLITTDRAELADIARRKAREKAYRG